MTKARKQKNLPSSGQKQSQSPGKKSPAPAKAAPPKGNSTAKTPLKSRAQSVGSKRIIEKKTKSMEKNIIHKKDVKGTDEAPGDEQRDQHQRGEIAKVPYIAGTFIAFLDPEAEDPSIYKIARLIEDFKQEDSDFMCDIFVQEKDKLTFNLSETKQSISERTFVSELFDVEVLKTKGRKNNLVTVTIKLAKQNAAKVQKLVPSRLKDLEAAIELGEEDGSNEDEEEGSDQEEEMITPAKTGLRSRNNAMSQPDQPRRFLKVKGAKAVEDIERNLRAKKQAQAGTNPKEDIQLEEVDSDEQQIKVVGKAPALTQKTTNKNQIQVPEVGIKRRKEEVDDEEDGDEDADKPALTKKRKVAAGALHKVETIKQAKPKKVAPKPTEYKKGTWNPHIQLVNAEPHKESSSSQFIQGCCPRCSNRNVHRAAWTGNLELLRACVHAAQTISSVNAAWSADDGTTPVEILIEKGDLKLLEALLRPTLERSALQEYTAVRSGLYHHRKADERYLLNLVESGTVSHMAYGTHVRAVGMTRGNRQGNNAFLQYPDRQKDPVSEVVSWAEILPGRKMSISTFKAIDRLVGDSGVGDLKQAVSAGLHFAARAGDWRFCEFVLRALHKSSNYGFNELHHQVVLEYKSAVKIPEFKSVSVTKKAHMNRNITPLHLACINPNPDVLRQLLEVNTDLNVLDAEMKRPIHYAAACENSLTLQLLLEKGANLADVDARKISCLHAAAIAKRPGNITFILQTNPSLLKLRDKTGLTAMAYACANGDMESIKALLENGAKVGQACGKEGKQPLAWAASLGNYELCEWLLDKKARVLSGDKFKRTPLALAVRNGHLKVASLLLQRGSDWAQADSSANTPLHYAAAYGWMECIDLLLKAGADINAQNSWKVTPINIAMLKNHEGCVKKFLEYPQVDVNSPDEKGRTLLILSLLDLGDNTVEFVKYLLEKGANPNICDVDGQGPLHYVAKFNPFEHYSVTRGGWGAYNQLQSEEELESARQSSIKRLISIQLELAEVLLSGGASLSKKDANDKTPFTLCLERENIDLLEKLMTGVSLNKEPKILHEFTTKILRVKYQEVLKKLVEMNTDASAATLNVLDAVGLTPMLSFVDQFCSAYSHRRALMLQLVNAQAAKHGKNFAKYEITNESLFKEFAYPQHHNLRRQTAPAPAFRARFGGQATKKAQFQSIAGANGNFGEADGSLDVVQAEVNETDKAIFADKLMNDLLVAPFLALIDFLTHKGADPHARVQKLQKFRELDEERRKAALSQEVQQIAEGQHAQRQVLEERAKKREEVLKERKARRVPEKGKKHRHGDQAHQKGVKSFKKEPEHHATMGLQNLFHLAVGCPHPGLVDFLIKKNVDPDLQDIRLKTPLNLYSSNSFFNFVDGEGRTFLDRLLSLDVRFDIADEKGRTPFLNYYGSERFTEAERFLRLGANVNQMDASGLYALKYALIRRTNPEIEKLVRQNGADINLLDDTQRNLLHHAINMSSATADASFEAEQLLIDLGIDINHRDKRGRTPLHYAFVKIKDWGNSTQIDPIETVSSMCGVPGLAVDVADKWKKTPLHYASQRGASICAMYLEKRGANLEAVDIHGNTPLGAATLAKHWNYGIIMIQQKADVTKLVHREDHKAIEELFKREEGKKEDEAMDAGQSETESDGDSKSKKHRHLFDAARAGQNVFYDPEYDSDESSEEQEDSDDAHEALVFNQQNAFGMQVFAAPAKKASAYPAAAKSGGFGAVPADSEELVTKAPDGTKQGQSMFRHAIRNGQLGIAYLTLDAGYSLALAMQDALDEQKFQLVLTLLAKTADDSVVQRQNDKQQNLLHILSQNTQCKPEHLRRIYNALKKRGVDCLAPDGFGRTALHYSVRSGSVELVTILLAEGASTQAVDTYGFTPLTLYLSGKSSQHIQLYTPGLGTYDPIFRALVLHGADVNRTYRESQFKPAYSTQDKLALVIDQIAYEKEAYHTTILINLVRNLTDSAEQLQQTQLRHSCMGLLQCGAKFDIVDSDGLDVMGYAVMSNNESLVDFLLSNSEAGRLRTDLQDVAGKSAIHYVVNPVRFGSYENTKILNKLAQKGYQLSFKDSAGMGPIDYAQHQSSGVMLKELVKLTRSSSEVKVRRTASGLSLNQWDASRVDFTQDADTLLKAAQEKQDQEFLQSGKQKELVPVDRTGQFPKSYSVLCEGKKPWDCYLTKVDLKNGIYGDYVFYKLQLLHDSVRDLYVVFTRWGRIGEDGMSQRTPFNNLQEAKDDFCKIFKSKTNNDFNDLSNFTKTPKKYNLARVNYVTVDHKEYLAPFSFDKAPKSALEKNVRELLEEVSNITMYQRAVQNLGLDTGILPVSGMKKEVIEQALEILRQIQAKTAEEVEMIHKGGVDTDHDALVAVRESISDLSSSYYELIPLSRYKDSVAPPLKSQHDLKQQFDALASLADIEHASKVLLGALFRQSEMHPIDYIYHALNLPIQYLDPTTPEYEVIQKYVKNTSDGALDFRTHKLKVFKVQRKGEAEAMESLHQIKNHRLLFHGSALFNFIGLLSQGMRIAPPEAPATGYMFGKGLYFADMFSKSVAYAKNHSVGSSSGSTLLLLCEVALGKQQKLWSSPMVQAGGGFAFGGGFGAFGGGRGGAAAGQPAPEWKLAHPYDSAFGVGGRGPDYARSLILPNGVEVPVGPVIESTDPDPAVGPGMLGGFGQWAGAGGYSLAHNEFIVYNTSQARLRYLIQVVKKTKEEMLQDQKKE